MKSALFFSAILLNIVLLTFCTNQSKRREVKGNDDNMEIIANKMPVINTIYEIKVYKDIIDQVYNVYLCRLQYDTPKSYLKYNENISKKEYEDYKAKYDLCKKQFDQMLDTSIITALVPDSLESFEIPLKFILSELDSVHIRQFHDLIFDSSKIITSPFILDSLKSKKIEFEKIPTSVSRLRWIDWEKVPKDSSIKFDKIIESFWPMHSGKQIGNKYYIGYISLSRVKFNSDSTKCLLECGYYAGPKCGSSSYYFLQKTKGHWVILKKIVSEVS